MDYFDCDENSEEFERILAEADPCEECGETWTLALVVITSKEEFGSLMVFCTECDQDVMDYRAEQNKKTLRA